ncbi:MAG TPA: transporter substrate-binding domain-containing protein [Thermoanaerobaculia bacterium]|nr:transporter substrate-binding domain-containing protein [Thermoanaerobaculia bacterium]
MGPSAITVPAPVRRRLAPAVLAVVVAAAVLGACRMPQDPQRTLEKARGAVLRVGVADAPPWVRRTGPAPGAEPAGVEPELVRGFAETIGARVEWHWGGPAELLAALERFELDLVIGGLTTTSPWKSHVGLTRGYHTERLEVGAPPGTKRPDSIVGLSVAVRAGTALANRLIESRAEALPADDPWSAGELVAAPAWELEARGYQPTGHVLHREHRALAVPPGENALLVALERYLRGREAEIDDLLRAEADRRDDEGGAPARSRR